MCKVYNPVGSLTEIKTHLQRHDINEFNSTRQLLDFQKKYPFLKQEIVANHTKIIQTEIEDLNKEIPHLKELAETKKSEIEELLSTERKQIDAEINSLAQQNSNLFNRVTNYIKTLRLKRKLASITTTFEKR